MNFDSLVGLKTTTGSIKRWINSSILDAETVLEEAQALVYRRLRVREMRTLAYLAPAVGDSSIALPARFQDQISLVDTRGMEYDFHLEPRLLSFRGYDNAGVVLSGQPSCYSIFDEALQFEVRFAETRALRLLCYRSLAPLSTSNETNFLTTRNPDLVRVACLAAAYDFLRNETERQVQIGLLDQKCGEINAESDLIYNSAHHETSIE